MVGRVATSIEDTYLRVFTKKKSYVPLRVARMIRARRPLGGAFISYHLQLYILPRVGTQDTFLLSCVASSFATDSM